MIEWTRIEELKSEVGEDEISEVLEIFCEEVGEVLAALAQADAKKLKSELHFLKGGAANIGFRDLSEMCAQFESALLLEPDIVVDISELKRVFRESTAALHQRHPGPNIQ